MIGAFWGSLLGLERAIFSQSSHGHTSVGICVLISSSYKDPRGFPGGSMVKNLPCRARDTSLIPDPGRSHSCGKQQSLWAQWLGKCSKAWELPLLGPRVAVTEVHAPCALQREKLPQGEARAPHWGVAPLTAARGSLCAAKKPHCSQRETPVTVDCPALWWPRANTCMPARLPQSRLTLCEPLDCSPPGSSVHGILQARRLEWVACHALLQGTFWTQGSNPRLHVSYIVRQVLYH